MANVATINFPLLVASVDTTNGNNIIAGVAGKTVRIYGWMLSTATTQTIIFKDGTTALTGAMTLNAGVPLVAMSTLDNGARPLLQLSSGNAFQATLSGSAQTSGLVWYTQGSDA